MDKNKAKTLFKTEMPETVISMERLHKQLLPECYSHTLSDVGRKMGRGTFGVTFPIQCLEAMDAIT